MTKKPSYRYLTERVELRAKGDTAQNVIGGYAARFDIETNLGWMTESIAPGAFDNVLQDDVRCLFNHDPNQILGRTISGTLRIAQDDKGLYYENDLSASSPIATHVADAISRGDISQSSFAFSIAEEKWTKKTDAAGFEYWHRTVLKCSNLYDVSPVTYPAYEDASVEELSKSLESFITREMPEEAAKLKEMRSKYYHRSMDDLHEQLEEAEGKRKRAIALRMRELALKIQINS